MLIFENLWKWSVKNPEIFWSEVWNFTKIKGAKGKRIIKKTKYFTKIFSFQNLN